MPGLLFDLAASVHYLRRRPLLILLAVGTLGIGIGVASALFGIVNALVLRPLPLDRGKEVHVVRWIDPAEGDRPQRLSLTEVNELLGASPAVAAYGAQRDWGFPLLQDGAHTPVDAVIATPGLFEVFRVAPHLGRLYTADDDHPGRNHVVLLSYAAWQRRFRGDPAIVGRSLTLGRDLYTVIGVLPEEFTAPSFRDGELWAPLSIDPDQGRGRAQRSLIAYARLAPGHAPADLRNEVRLRGERIATGYGSPEKQWRPRTLPLIEAELGNVLQRLVLIGLAVGLLLAMACANLAVVILAESLGRRAELGVRAALGGSMPRLFVQLLMDNALLCLAGGVAAAAIATALLSLARRFALADIPRFDQVHPDLSSAAFALALCLAVAVVFTALSVFWSARGEPAEHIRATGRSFATASSRRVLGWMVAAQIAFELVLLSFAFVFAQSYGALANAAPGFDDRGLLLLRVRTAERMGRDAIVPASEHARDDVAVMPGVGGAAIASAGPMFGPQEDLDVTAVGSTLAASRRTRVRYANVDTRFLNLMRIPLLAGRGFATADDARSRTLVVIVSRSLAARLYPNAGAVGKMLLVGEHMIGAEIIGVAGDTADAREPHGGGIDLYLPFAQSPRGSYFLVARGAALPAVSERLRKSLPGFLLLSAKTMQETIDEYLVVPKLQMTLMIVFAIAAAILATIAVYGMVTLSAARRGGEIGLRLALGATPGQLQLLLMRGLAGQLAAGVAAGIFLLVAAAPRLRAALAGVRPDRPLAVAAAVAAVSALTVAASWRSVRAAAAREPSETLRSE